MTQHEMMRKLKMTSGLLREISLYRHHVEHRVKLYMPKEESFPVPLKDIDITSATNTSLHDPVAILAQAISCWNVRMVFSASRAFLVLSCPSVCNPVCWFPTVLMARVDDVSNVPKSPLPATSLNFGSPDGSGPDLDVMGHRSYDAQFKELRDMSLPLVRGVVMQRQGEDTPVV